MSQPKRRVLHQYGYRINETGAERWGRFDLQYNGANSAERHEVEKSAKQAVERAAALGFTVTTTILRRDHLTTTWERWVPGVIDEGAPL